MASRRTARLAPRSTIWQRPCRSASARPRPGGSRSCRIKISFPSGLIPPTCSFWPTSPLPTHEQAERLGRLVKAGMGLLIFTGGKLDVGLYNDLLYRADNRVLPFPLKSLVDENIRGLFIEPLRPSPLEKLLELKPSALERVSVRQIMTVEEKEDRDQVRVLARWNNPARSPAIAERVAGRGPRALVDDHRRSRRQ